MTSIRHFRWLALIGILSAGIAWAQGPEGPQTFTVPAGTRIITRLRSPLNTTSAVSDSGVYLESIEPIVIDNHVAIPARSLIQGMVETDKRPGHLDRSSRLRFHFTTLIFPNDHVATIDGVLLSIPGSGNYRKKDSAGTTGTVDQVEKTLPKISALALTGALFGSVKRTRIGGIWAGAGLGAALGIGEVLLRRGDEIALHEGSRMEIILKAPVSVSQQVIAENNALLISAQKRNIPGNVGNVTEPISPEPARSTPNPLRPRLNPWPMQSLPVMRWYTQEEEER